MGSRAELKEGLASAAKIPIASAITKETQQIAQRIQPAFLNLSLIIVTRPAAGGRGASGILTGSMSVFVVNSFTIMFIHFTYLLVLNIS